MRLRRLSLLVLVAGLTAGCGEILNEIDNANELASKPSGNRPVTPAKPGAPPGPGAAPKAGAAPVAKAAPAPATAPEEEVDLLTRVKIWLGLEVARPGGRLPPDPNDPMVICRLGGGTSFMLKSGCVNRQGTVVASKGVPR